MISKNTNREICKWVDNTGYYQCLVYKDKKRCHKRIHRLMAETFLINEYEDVKLQVNHIDGNKLNNNIDNLELVTNKENTIHGYENQLYSTRKNIKVEVFTKNHEYINTYKSIRELSRELNLNRKTVSSIIFHNKINNYEYIFKPIISDPFYYIDVYNKEDEKIIRCHSLINVEETIGVDRKIVGDIINNKINNDTDYIFQKIIA